MRWYLAVGLSGALAAPAAAQVSWCEALWIDRNTVLNRAGQCFETPLAQALFDNSDCVPGERALTPLDQFIVETLRMREAQAGCALDTARNAPSAEMAARLERLRVLWTVPIRAETEHACGDYQGPPRDLHAGISSDTPVIGRLEPGQNFNFSYDQMRGGWEYIQVSDGELERVAHGWVRDIEMNGDVCGYIAG